MKITKFAELQHVYNVINIPSLIFLEEDIWPLIRPWELAADSSLLLLEDLIYINILVPSCEFTVQFGVTLPLLVFVDIASS